MVILEKRSTWTTRPMTCAPRKTGRYPATVVHWIGVNKQMVDQPHSNCLRTLRALETYAMDREGYGALPYQAAACPHRRLIEGRTADMTSGANGSVDANAMFGCVVALIGTQDPVTDELLEAILAAPDYLRSLPVLKTHNEVRPEPTACPGPDLTRWIDNNHPSPTEADVELTDKVPLTKSAAAVFGRDSLQLGTLLSIVARDSKLAREYAQAAATRSGVTDAELAAIREAVGDGIDVRVTID